MSLAEQLIDTYLDEKVVKGKELSGKEVANLKAKQHIFIKGKHAVVVAVNKQGDNVELVYVKGRKAFGKEQYMDVPMKSTSTGVMMGKSVDDEG